MMLHSKDKPPRAAGLFGGIAALRGQQADHPRKKAGVSSLERYREAMRKHACDCASPDTDQGEAEA